MNIIKRICNWYFSRNALPYWCILALDCTAVYISGLLVSYIMHGGLWLAQHFWPVVLGLLCSLIVFIIAFMAYHTFRGVMRYSSFVDLTRLALSTATSCVVVSILHLLQEHTGISEYILFPHFHSALLLFIVATSLMCALRVIVKSLHDTYCISENTRNIFIYGCLSGAKDIKIEFTGLRDGEKLYEELLATKENTIPTVHPKIRVAQVREYPHDLALKNELELYEISKGFDDMAIVKKMKEIVPEYKSLNNKYREIY